MCLALMLFFRRMSFHAVPIGIFELSLHKTLGIPCSLVKSWSAEGSFAFSLHAIHQSELTGLPHEELCTGDATIAGCRTEQGVNGKGFSKLGKVGPSGVASLGDVLVLCQLVV